MSSQGVFINVETVLPTCPVHAVKSSRCAAQISLAAPVLSLDLFAVTSTDDFEHAICFLKFAKAQLDLCITEFSVDALFVVGRCIRRIVLWEDVIL